MKKLNKKGFTLVELLAVIVILAVIMVITIPTVLSSMSGAKQGAIDSAAKAIEDYVEKQYELCTFGNSGLTGTDYTNIFDDSCKLTTDKVKGTLLTAAGYTGKFDEIYVVPAMNDGKYTGQFNVYVHGDSDEEFGAIWSEGYADSVKTASGVAGGTISSGS